MIQNKIQLRQLNLYLLISVGFSMSMLLFRMLFTGSLYYVFLAWNLFLAFIPLWISSRLVKKQNRRWYHLVLAGSLWLLFLPNAPYIITDFIHLEDSRFVPHWFDLMLILTFAWNGLLFWLITMFHFNTVIENRINPKLKFLLTQFIILLSAVGVYLGRYGRFNSWDAFFEPIGIIGKVVYMIFHPVHFPGFYGMVLAVYVFLALLFGFIDKVRQTGIPELLTQNQRHELK